MSQLTFQYCRLAFSFHLIFQFIQVAKRCCRKCHCKVNKIKELEILSLTILQWGSCTWWWQTLWHYLLFIFYLWCSRWWEALTGCFIKSLCLWQAHGINEKTKSVFEVCFMMILMFCIFLDTTKMVMRKPSESKATTEEEDEEVNNPDKEDCHSVCCLHFTLVLCIWECAFARPRNSTLVSVVNLAHTNYLNIISWQTGN